MTDMPAAAGSGRAPGRAEPGLILRHDLVAALSRAAQKQVTIISAPAGTGKTSLLRAWAGRPGQDCRVAFLTVRPGQHDMQLFWLTVLGAIRAAEGTGDGCAQLPPVTPGASGSALVDKVLSELEESCDRFVLVIDDLQSRACCARRRTAIRTASGSAWQRCYPCADGPVLCAASRCSPSWRIRASGHYDARMNESFAATTSPGFRGRTSPVRPAGRRGLLWLRRRGSVVRTPIASRR